MANIITLSAYQQGTTPPSKQIQLGVASILSVYPYSSTSFPTTNAVVFTNNPALPSIFTAEAPSTIKTLSNAALT